MLYPHNSLEIFLLRVRSPWSGVEMDYILDF